MVKRLLLVLVLIIAGCHCDNRVPVKPASKVDRQSEVYQDMLSRIIRAKLMELEWQEYQKWAAQQGYNGVTNGTEF